MGWVADATAQWVRILTASGGPDTVVDEGVRLISEIGPPAGKVGRGRRRRKLVVPAEVTALSRQLLASLLASDYLVGQLCSATIQSREQVLSGLSAGLSQWLQAEQVRVMQLEISSTCVPLQDQETATYGGLGTRIEQLLRLAERESLSIVAEARAEAAKITAAARQPRPCPHCGASPEPAAPGD